MKKVFVALGICFILIAACMIYLAKKGVSLRSAPVIGPTLISVGPKQIAQSVVVRLTPQFESSKLVVWGLDSQSAEHLVLFKTLQEAHELAFGVKVNVISDANTVEQERIRDCQKPCWLVVDSDKANSLDSNSFIMDAVLPLKRDHFSVSLLSFKKDLEVPADCEDEQRISFHCITPLSVREFKRKFKTADRYFFMRAYNAKDFFLFLESQ